MENGVNRSNQGIDTDKPDGRAGGSTNCTSTTTARTGSTGSTGTGSTGTGREAEKEAPVRLVTVEDGKTEEERKRDERNQRRRERYQEQKAQNGQSVKPRKVNKGKKTEAPTPVSKEQFNNLIVSTSAVIASRPNCSHWLLTEAEADSITTPLLAIIAESEKLEMITKNSNQIALVIACITIIAPRLFVTIQQNKAMPKKEKKPNGNGNQIKPPERSNPPVSKADDKQPANHGTDNDYVLSWDD